MSPEKFLSWAGVIPSIAKDALRMLLLGSRFREVAALVPSPIVQGFPRDTALLSATAGGTWKVTFMFCIGLAQACSEALCSEQTVARGCKAAFPNHGPRGSPSCGGGVCSANSAAMDVGTITSCPRRTLEHVLAQCKIVYICVLRENTLLTGRNGKNLKSSAHNSLWFWCMFTS